MPWCGGCCRGAKVAAVVRGLVPWCGGWCPDVRAGAWCEGWCHGIMLPRSVWNL
ncbi:hypothetical protein [Bartonella elizabethae]